MTIQGFSEQLAQAARDLGSENVETTLETAVRLAVELLDDCHGAGVTLVRRDKTLQTPVATADWVARGDALQYELQEGPCVDAVWVDEIVYCNDLAQEQRWPSWAPRVVDELGVRSMLCLQLFTDHDKVGALNLYSSHPNGFIGVSDQHEAQALASHASVALVAALEIQHLNTVVTNRAVIGQAEGILMERFDIEADRAFHMLQRASSHTNIKLHQIAVEFVRTRHLPSSDAHHGQTPGADVDQGRLSAGS